jgi:Mg2+-importing ATPase
VDILVPGDVVHLAAGDLAPADCRLIEARDLFVNQALLTGESYPVEKAARDLPEAKDSTEAVNTLFMGSSVLTGSAVALVCRTGHATFLAHSAGSLAERAPPDAFQVGIRAFGMLMLRLTLFLVLFVLLASLALQRPWLESLMFALALAVGLTPELLPAIVTVTLARGAVRLGQCRVVVKRLPAMHNLGAMDVLCTDKTGTLTESKISLVRHVDHQGEESEHVFRLAWLNSHFESGIRSPLDQAILEHGEVDVASWRKLDEAPFDFGRRRVSVLLAQGERRLLVVKGAPEDVLRVSDCYEAKPDDVHPLDAAARERLETLLSKLSDEGLRVLAVATRSVENNHDTAALSDETQLTFVGYAVFLDPPKASAPGAIVGLAAAGVDIKVLTGDNERVTRHICAELGLPVDELITGDALARLSDEALFARVDRINVFCRMTPQQKHHVLLALKRRGRRIGFLGDGVNDAAALHAADVGISVDSAADVAKEAADVILLERDLGVIREAVAEGRRTVRNVTKYILMGTSSNFGNMISMAGAALFLPFLPMLPVQVLMNNLLYDCSELGIPFDRVEAQELARPVRWDLAEIQRSMLILGPISSAFDFLTFAALIAFFGAAPPLFQTGWFIESLATQALVIFAIRSRRGVFATRPHPFLTLLALSAVVVGALLPLTPIGTWFGFVTPPPRLYLFLALTVAAYLALVVAVRPLVYRRPKPVPFDRHA